MAERVRYEVFVRLDVGKGEHHACALDPDGKRLYDGCWPAVWTVEMFDGALQFGSAGDPKWDWRSVVMAARAYPGWRIALHDGFLLSAVPPEPEAGTRRTS